MAKPRGCTDVLCLALFITFWAVMVSLSIFFSWILLFCSNYCWVFNTLIICSFYQIFVAAFAFVVGNPLRLVNGFDSFGNVCGVDNRNDESTDADKLANNNSITLSGLDMSDRPWVFVVVSTIFKDIHYLCYVNIFFSLHHLGTFSSLTYTI